MTTLTVALIVCTALCLIWKESRGLGIVGVFALIFVAPLVFGSLLVVAGLIYYFLFRRSRYEFIPKGNVLPPDEASRRRRGLGLLVLAAGVAGVLALGYAPQDRGRVDPLGVAGRHALGTGRGDHRGEVTRADCCRRQPSKPRRCSTPRSRTASWA